PPRAANERILNREMWSGIILVGLVMAIISLVALDLGLPGGLFEGSGDGTRARTLAFTTLVLAQLFNCMNAPSDRQSALRGLFRNHLVWIAIFVSLVLQAAVVQAPFLNRAFGTAPLDIGDWIMCLALASLVLWAAEIRKLFLRVSERRG